MLKVPGRQGLSVTRTAWIKGHEKEITNVRAYFSQFGSHFVLQECKERLLEWPTCLRKSAGERKIPRKRLKMVSSRRAALQDVLLWPSAKLLQH